MPDPSTILLVDDEDSIQKLLAYPLEREGFRVLQARDGEEAMAQFAAEDVDLVVLGADDYITKPFSIREFRSRVRALLRRAAAPRRPEEDGDVISAEDLTIDLARRTVEVRAERTQLTYVEFELLRILAANPGRVYSRRMLLEALWG